MTTLSTKMLKLSFDHGCWYLRFHYHKVWKDQCWLVGWKYDLWHVPMWDFTSWPYDPTNILILRRLRLLYYNVYHPKNNETIRNDQSEVTVKHTESRSDNEMEGNVMRVKIKMTISRWNYCSYLSQKIM